MKNKTRRRDIVHRPAPNRPQDVTQKAFDLVRKECQGTGPKVRKAGRSTR